MAECPDLIWIVERNDEYDQRLIDTLRGQGVRCRVASSELMSLGKQPDLAEGIDGNACVLCRGSISFISGFQRREDTRLWLPHSWCRLRDFECTSYMPALARWLLNDRYVMLPAGDLLRQKDWLFEQFPYEVFLRPNKSTKPFTGFAVRKEDFEKEVCDLLTWVGTDCLVVVAPVQRIVAEWRFVVARDAVITGSQYIRDNQITIRPGCDMQAWELAQAVVASKPPFEDRMYVLDVARLVSGQYRVVEPNSFSSSCLYEANYEVVAACAKRLAAEEWHEYND